MAGLNDSIEIIVWLPQAWRAPIDGHATGRGWHGRTSAARPPGGRTGLRHLVLTKEEVKNSEAHEYELASETSGGQSISAWILGYPDRASRLSDDKDAHARRRGHPFDLGFALTMGAHEYDHRCQHEDLRKRAEECERW